MLKLARLALQKSLLTIAFQRVIASVICFDGQTAEFAPLVMSLAHDDSIGSSSVWCRMSNLTNSASTSTNIQSLNDIATFIHFQSTTT